jgi:ribonuclease HI
MEVRGGKKISRSNIKAETLAVVEGIETAILLKRIWKELTTEEVKIIVRTDSKTLSKAIYSTSGVNNKRLRIDIAVIKEALEKKEVEKIEWVKTGDQVADVFIKEDVKREAIKRYVEGGEKKNVLD